MPRFTPNPETVAEMPVTELLKEMERLRRWAERQLPKAKSKRHTKSDVISQSVPKPEITGIVEPERDDAANRIAKGGAPSKRAPLLELHDKMVDENPIVSHKQIIAEYRRLYPRREKPSVSMLKNALRYRKNRQVHDFGGVKTGVKTD